MERRRDDWVAWGMVVATWALLIWASGQAHRSGYEEGWVAGGAAVVGTLDTAALRRIATAWDSTGCVWWAPPGGGFVVTRARP